MRIIYKLAIWAILLCLAISITPMVTADEDSMVVIITLDENIYEAGDSGTVTVHVFDKGEYAEPDQDPTVSIGGDSWYDDDGAREVKTSKKSAGKYEGTFDIYDSDAEGGSSLDITLVNTEETAGERSEDYALSIGRADDDDETYNYINKRNVEEAYITVRSEDKGLKVEMRISDYKNYPFEPGDKISMEVIVTLDGKKVDPEEFELTSSVYDYGDDGGYYYDDDDYYYGRSGTRESSNGDVPYNNPSDGVYEADFTIPSSLEANARVSISAYAEEDDKYGYDGLSFNVDFYQVWMHCTDSTTSKTRDFDIYVADMDGKVVEDAPVTIKYREREKVDNYGYEYYTYKYVSQTEDTDSEGKASFTKKNVDTDISIDGWVDHDGDNQTFSGYLRYTGDDEDDDPYNYFYGFTVELLDDDVDISKDNELNFKAWNDSDPFESQTIYYYIYTSYEVLDHGSVKTNSKGKFKLTVPEPSGDKADSVRILFETDTEDHPTPKPSYDWDDDDYDGFSDNFEKKMGTDPDDDDDYPSTYRDTDGDDFGDKYEDHMGTDPDDDDDYPTDYEDSDGDGHGDAFEESVGTDPDSYYSQPDETNDTDYDGHTDEEEAFYGTDPDDSTDYPHNTYMDNSDDDYITSGYSWYYNYDYQFDGEEVFYGTDPEDDDDYPYDEYQDDSDGDGVCDLEEAFYGSDPDDRYDDPSSTYIYYDYSDHVSNDGRLYEEDYISISLKTSFEDYVSDDVNLKIDKFQIGKINTIEVSVPDNTNEYIAAGWFMGDISDSSLYGGGDSQGSWQCWGGGDSEIFLLPSGDSKLTGDIVVPEFLPKGNQKYTFIVLYADYDTNEYKVNYLTLKHGQSGNTQDDDTSFLDQEIALGLTVLHMGIIVIIILILAMGLILILIIVKVKGGKKKKTPAAGGDQQQQQQGQGGTPPPPSPDQGQQQQQGYQQTGYQQQGQQDVSQQQGGTQQQSSYDGGQQGYDQGQQQQQQGGQQQQQQAGYDQYYQQGDQQQQQTGYDQYYQQGGQQQQQTGYDQNYQQGGQQQQQAGYDQYYQQGGQQQQQGGQQQQAGYDQYYQQQGGGQQQQGNYGNQQQQGYSGNQQQKNDQNLQVY